MLTFLCLGGLARVSFLENRVARHSQDESGKFRN